jgi:RHS repeat-associated protein
VTMADGYVTASYNALNQPVVVWSPSNPNAFTWFGYDPLGRCVKRWVGGSGDANSNPATYMYYDGWNILQEGPGGLSVTRVYAHGARVDEIVASSNESGAVLFHHYDALGNCILLSDGAGNVYEQYDYEAFGKPYFYNAAGVEQPSSAWNNRFLFTGREWLSDLRLYDYRNRLYQPELGRFMQPDPKEFAAGDYNLYRYCHNDPVNKSDPTGLISLTSSGRGDWDFDNGRVALEQMAQQARALAKSESRELPGGSGNDKPQAGRANGPDEATIQKGRPILARQTGEGEDTTGAIVNGQPVPGDRNRKGEQVPYRFGKPVYKDPNAPPSLKRVDHIEEVVPPGRSDLLTHYHTRGGRFAEPTPFDMNALRKTKGMLFSNPALKAAGAYRIYRNGVPGYETRHDLYDP